TAMAYGSRLLQQEERDETPRFRRWGIWGLSVLQNLASGLRLVEWYSGFRAFRCSALQQVPFQACDNDYYFDVQIILLLSMAGYSVAEIPVAKKYEGNHSPVNIYQFSRKVLAHMLRYPFAKWELLSCPLFQRRHWESLRQITVPAPVYVGGTDPALEGGAQPAAA